MDNIVVLTPNKKLVRLKTDKYELTSLFFDMFGVLHGFNVGATRYIFVDKTNYLEEDREKKDLVVGFVKYESYNEYVSSEQDYYNYKYIIDPQEWFDSNFQEAKIGDIFKIEKVETSLNETNNYIKYFVRNKSEFKITNLNIDFSDSSQYPSIDSNINSPNYSIKQTIDLSTSLLDTAQSYFFKKNLGNKISSLPSTVDDEAKKILYVGMIKICWRIRNLYLDVLEKIAIKPLSEILSIATQSVPTNIDIRTYINNLSNISSIDKVIARLLVEWGYRDEVNTLELFPILSGDQFYGGYYTPFNNYYNTLVNIYVNAAYNKKEEDLFNVNTDPNTWSPEFTLKQSNLRLQYLVSIIPDDSINFLDLATKIKILKDFARNSIYESREDAVIKIVRSIQISEALPFLYALQNETFTDGTQTVTLFEKLYDKINDKIFLFGKNNRREFMNRLYSLWYVSALNPYNGLDLSLSNNNPATTTNNFNTFYKNKVTALNYNSKKFFGFFVDNMNFDFNSKSITVFEEKQVGYKVIAGGEVVPDEQFVKIGDYDFYTAISLKEFKEGDTAVKLPAIALEGNSGNKSYIIPIFYLKYMDDFGDNEDMWTAIGLTIDIALTFTGIGNISKLRHFRHLTKLGRLALGEALPASERILALEALSGTAALVELTSSVASIILQYYTAGCTIYIPAVEANVNDTNPNGQIPDAPNSFTQEQKKKYEWCKSLDQFLFWAQMASAGTDFISGYMLRKSARNLKQIGIPDDFPPTGKQFIDDIADLDGALLDFLNTIQNSHPNIYNKVSNFANEEDKFAFMFDFKGNSNTLTKLENDLNSTSVHKLIDDWAEVSNDLKHLRKNIDYLNVYNILTKNQHEVKHVTDLINSSPGGGFHPKGAHGGKNLSNGTFWNPYHPTPPPGKTIQTAIHKSQNGHVTFEHIYFVNPNGGYRKKSLQTIINPTWDDVRIKGEMAYARLNMRAKGLTELTGETINDLAQRRSIFKSFMTDGTEVEIHMYNRQVDIVTGNTYNNHMGYFQLILK